MLFSTDYSILFTARDSKSHWMEMLVQQGRKIHYHLLAVQFSLSHNYISDFMCLLCTVILIEQ